MAAVYNYNAGPTYIKISSQTLGSAAASVTFSSIPQGYTDLILVVNSASASVDAFTYLQFNGDTATNYSHTQLYGNGTSALSSRASNTSTMLNVDVNMETTTIMYNAIYQIMNYSNSTTFKTTLVRQNNTGSDYPGALAGVGLWRNTSPVTAVTIQATRGGTAYNFVSGSTFSIYGITAALKPKATGGNTVTTDGTYWYHTFTSSGVFTPTQSINADYLVVAGGGSGGSETGSALTSGGGGAGGLRSTVTATGGGGSLETALSLSLNTAYTVTIGAGGAVPAWPSRGTAGSDSVFSTITSTGGGGGGAYNTNKNGGTGGSGGGASHPSGTGGAGTTNQGYAGGNGSSTDLEGASGGGGGAGAVGSAASVGSQANGGAGGNGVAVSISGSSVTYAGGGGGGSTGTNSASGGTGGGGTGAKGSTAGTAGTANTGGGGGGGANYSGVSRPGGNGGSGVVIVRYSA